MSSLEDYFLPELDPNKRKLLAFAMKRNWPEVLEICEKNREIHTAKITISGETPLHLAIADGQDAEIVERLVEIIKRLGTFDALKVKNEQGNTPLHLAAALGNIRMCICIASVDRELIGLRNNDGETPFFLAVLHGRKDAFLLLNRIISERNLPGLDFYYLCRRYDGSTILHCAIDGEYFDLAFQIIYLCMTLVFCINERAFTPLHVLVSKPSAFKSGSHLGLFSQIIYPCISVDKLIPELEPVYVPEVVPLPTAGLTGPGLASRFRFISSYLLKPKPEFKPVPVPAPELDTKYLEKYKTCIKFAKLLQKAFHSFTGGRKHELGQQPASDVECQRQEGMEAQGHHRFRATYITCFEAFKFMSKAMVNTFVSGAKEMTKIVSETKVTKQKHLWSVEVLGALLFWAFAGGYAPNGKIPREHSTSFDPMLRDDVCTAFDPTREEASLHDSKGNKSLIRETPVLIAARNGITEMVQEILTWFPVAAQEINCDEKNILHLAVENRQPHVYELLLQMRLDSLFRKKDKYGNSALHLAATLGKHGTWPFPAVQMQWEIKWFEYVKNSMPPGSFTRLDNKGKTPDDVFIETHQDLVNRGGEWLTNTAQSCSFVGALVATVAFTTSTTFPGGVTQDIGTPTLKGEPVFQFFTISSLIALCFSVSSVVMFLIILTTRYRGKDFRTSLPMKLLLGLTSLFISVTAMLISFCAGHFFLLRDQLKHPTLTFLVYGLACMPATFALTQFPLYYHIILATLKKFPHRRYRVIP